MKVTTTAQQNSKIWVSIKSSCPGLVNNDTIQAEMPVRLHYNLTKNKASRTYRCKQTPNKITSFLPDLTKIQMRLRKQITNNSCEALNSRGLTRLLDSQIR